MARLEFSGTRNTAPRWMGDFGDRQSLLPGGGRVNKFKFTEVNSIRQIPSGVLLGRRANATHWEPVNNNLNTNLSTVLTAAVASGSTILPVGRTLGYRGGDIITIAAVDYTIATNGVNDLNRTLTITAGLNASATSGVAVALKTAVAHDGF